MVTYGYEPHNASRNERPKADEPPTEKPSSEGEKDKLGSFKIEDGDVIGKDLQLITHLS
jgi:hypothetical protein